QQMQWRKFKEIRISNGTANSSQITVQYEIFVRKSPHLNYFMTQCYKKRDQGYDRLLCAEMCMVAHNCLTWMYSGSTQTCYRCDRIYGAIQNIFEDQFTTDRTFELYEKVNPCNTHLLCEHGSQCVPDFTTETYTCERCFAPYTGKHCNETGPPSPSYISKEVKAGHNSTCRHIKLHYNIPDYEGLRPFVLHPWNDQRTIKILCSGFRTIITSLNTSKNGVRDLTSTDFADGLDLITGDINFRANSLFFDAILKQIDIDNIYFKCVQQSIYAIPGTNIGTTLGTTHLKSSWRQRNPIEYFANRRGYNTGIKMSDSNPEDTISSAFAVNGDWSSPGLQDSQAEQRTFKDVIVLNDTRRLSFTNHTKECFGSAGGYFEFSFE
uniref:EGF-like domain-containing protein n=2 Tax=Clytia hemisphaerica TaxID=252671 RepID=A0A7M5XAA2_9CNID